MKKLKIHLCSDIHTETGYYSIPEMEDEANTIVVLAGDIGIAKRPEATYLPLVKNCCERFKHVLMCCGNHEHWGCDFNLTYSRICTDTLEFDNFDLLEKETKVIDGVAFIGATLWTDMDKGNPILKMDVVSKYGGMNDYHKIRISNYARPFRPVHSTADHLRAKEYIFPEITKQKAAGNKTVVITHHLPSYKSVPLEYRGQKMNGAYASELGNEICDAEPDLWCHGHSHGNSNYIIGKTRIVNNPKGYAEGLNLGFIDNLIIEV